MTYFNRGGGFNRGGSDRPRFNDRGFDKPEMHTATCDQCGKTCEVPFRPNGSKPVFCSSCFEAKGNGGSDRSYGRNSDRPTTRNFERSSSFGKSDNNKEDFAALNKRVDKMMEMLFAIKQSLAVDETPEKVENEQEDVEKVKKEITERIKKTIKAKKEEK